MITKQEKLQQLLKQVESDMEYYENIINENNAFIEKFGDNDTAFNEIVDSWSALHRLRKIKLNLIAIINIPWD